MNYDIKYVIKLILNIKVHFSNDSKKVCQIILLKRKNTNKRIGHSPLADFDLRWFLFSPHFKSNFYAYLLLQNITDFGVQ